MKRDFKSFFVFLAVMGAARITSGGIFVAPILSISDGIHPTITIIDNSPADLNRAIGELTLSTNVGVWNLSISTGITAPALGSFTNPVMDLVIQASSTGAGSLTYTFSQINFAAPKVAGTNLSTTVSGQVISGAPTTVDYSVFGDPSNVVNAKTVLLATTGTNALPVLISNSGITGLSNAFSLTQVVQLTASGASSVSVDASLNVIPEPSSWGLTFLGLAFLVAGLAHRRRSLHGVNLVG